MEELDLGELWRSLVDGKVTLTATAHRDGRCFGVLATCDPARPMLRPNTRDALERLLSGAPQKVVAADIGLSLAALSVRSASALRALGASAPISRTPILLVMAALAARGLAPPPALLEKRADGVRIASAELPGADSRRA